MKLKTGLQKASSLKVTVVCLFLLFILTFWGTLYQVNHGLYQAQHQFFYSWVVWINRFLPFPGALAVMTVLFLNLAAAFVFIFKFKWKKLGIICIHIGILSFLVGGFVTHYFGEESFITFAENESTNVSTAYHDWELALWGETHGQRDVQAIDLQDLQLNKAIQLSPFNISVDTIFKNATLIPSKESPQLHPLPENFEPAENIPGATLQIKNDNSTVILHGGQPPLPIAHNGKSYWLAIQRKRFEIPMTIKLIDFKQSYHPRTNIAKEYESIVLAKTGTFEREIRISMNHPLRHQNFTLYQASFSVGPMGNETSTLAVVHNVGRLFPYVSSTITVLGLIIHFGWMLIRSNLRRPKQ